MTEGKEVADERKESDHVAEAGERVGVGVAVGGVVVAVAAAVVHDGVPSAWLALFGLEPAGLV